MISAAAVIGGGLLGLEAAKAVADMGCESHIIEFADTLMCRQIDAGGHGALAAHNPQCQCTMAHPQRKFDRTSSAVQFFSQICVVVCMCICCVL